MPTNTPINYNNAKDTETHMAYPEFFETIWGHRAFTLYAEFDYSLTRFYSEEQRQNRSTDTILKEFEKEKKKLMKLLQPYKNLCKQPGSVIDQVCRMERRRLHRDVYPTV